MIVRPTTDQIILDCCRELMEEVLPTVTDETTQVRIIMIDTVLRNAAVRASHEIAWMREETAGIMDYGRTVAAAQPGADELSTALEGLSEPSEDSTQLADVVAVYTRAGNLLSLSLEVAIRAQDAGLVASGEQLLEARNAHEHEVLAGWSPTGR